MNMNKASDPTTRHERGRHTIFVFLFAIGLIVVVAAKTAWDAEDRIPWFEDGPLGPWLTWGRLIYLSYMLAICAVLIPPGRETRSLTLWFLAVLITGVLSAIGQFGTALLLSWWTPVPTNAIHLALPILGGLFFSAPVLSMHAISALRRNPEIREP
jgi:uncharacterized membrane protein YkvI